MNKAQLVTKIQNKVGFHSFVTDDKGQIIDREQIDRLTDGTAPILKPLQKRFFYINHLNADGTMGQTYIFYIYNLDTGDAYFYNNEVESIDVKEKPEDYKRQKEIADYLETQFEFVKVLAYDDDTKKLLAEVYIDNGNQTGTKKQVVAKKKAGVFSHIVID